MISRIYDLTRYCICIINNGRVVSDIEKQDRLNIYYGCGHIKQPGYINVDIRWTPAVDMIGDLQWCGKKFPERCDEVYLSHVIEHYGFPGKANRETSDTILGALKDINTLLKPGGTVRLAVPDFRAIAKLYLEDGLPLFPRLLGRLYGEQNYPQNLHKCGFDREFLSSMLEKVGFECIEDWKPEDIGLETDASFDNIGGIRTSLNLMAKKTRII